jgi:hypothetical protein
LFTSNIPKLDSQHMAKAEWLAEKIEFQQKKKKKEDDRLTLKKSKARTSQRIKMQITFDFFLNQTINSNRVIKRS